MKDISLAAAIEKNKLFSDQPWLVALKIRVKNPVTHVVENTIRVVRNDETVTIDGESYQPLPFEISIEENAQGIPSVTVTFQDQTRIVQSYMQSYAGGIGFPVEVIVVTGADKDSLSSEADLVEFFEVVNASSSSDSYTAVWELGIENPLSVEFPRRKQYTDQCSFRYKGPECGYSGALQTCDKTLNGINGCVTHNNKENFGGFPGLIARG